jgi:hypothetical protein
VAAASSCGRHFSKSGVVLDKFLCCVDRLADAFDGLLNHTASNPLDSLDD